MISPLIITVFLCEVLLMFFAIYLIFSFINKTPFYPSSIKQLNKLKSSGIIDLSKYNNFVDIGSGDGRIVRWAINNGFSTSEGIEYNPYLTIYSRLRSIFNKKVKIHNKNFKNHDYSNNDIAYLYIFPEHMDAIKAKLFTQMKPGSLILTNTFKFSEIEPDQTFERISIYYVK